jgi:hypothetical protein
MKNKKAIKSIPATPIAESTIPVIARLLFPLFFLSFTKEIIDKTSGIKHMIKLIAINTKTKIINKPSSIFVPDKISLKIKNVKTKLPGTKKDIMLITSPMIDITLPGVFA